MTFSNWLERLKQGKNTAPKQGPAPALLKEQQPVGTYRLNFWLYHDCTRSHPQGFWRLNNSLIWWQESQGIRPLLHRQQDVGFYFDTLATLSAQYWQKNMRGRPRGDEQQEKAKQLHPVHSHLGYATLILKKVPHIQWRKVQTIGTTKAQLLSATLMYSCIASKRLF